MTLCAVLTGFIFYLLFYGRIQTHVLMGGAVVLSVVCFFYLKRYGHMHGRFLSLDVRASQSPLKDYHPGLKICFCTGCALLCTASDSLLVSLFIFISMMLLCTGPGKVPLHYYLSLLALPLTFILLGTAALLIEVSPGPLGYLDMSMGSWMLCVTPFSQARAGMVMGRALGAVSCLYLLSLSTPMYQIVGFLRKIRIPGLIVELMYFVYRYIFVLLDTQEHMRTAAMSRAGYRDGFTALRTMLKTSANLLFLSFRRSSDCFAAMESRCYDGKVAFWETESILHLQEVLAALLYIGFVLFLWVLDRRLS